MITTIVNGTLLDTDRMELVGERNVTIEDDRIVEVDSAAPTVAADRVIPERAPSGLLVRMPSIGGAENAA